MTYTGDFPWVGLSSRLPFPPPAHPLPPTDPCSLPSESWLMRNHSDRRGQWAVGVSLCGRCPAQESDPALEEITMLRTKGTTLSVKRMSRYPCSAVEGEVSSVALLARWGSHSPPVSHSSESWSQTDCVQMVALPVISYGTLGKPFNLSEFHSPCLKMRSAQCMLSAWHSDISYYHS